MSQRALVGSQAVVVDGRGRVLLQLRGWPAGWEPPGGHIAHPEDPTVTVIRETREETGLDIEVERLIGYYQFRGLRHDADVVYRARAVGGRLHPNKEALRLVWTDPRHLPRSLFPWYRQRIADALRPPAEQPLERTQRVSPGTVLLHGLALVADGLGFLLPPYSRPRTG